MRKKIYIAGPYTKGDVAENVAKAISAWYQLWQEGFSPFCPHLSHFLHIQKQLPYENWLSYNLEWLPSCDGILRLPGESAGADRETSEANKLGMPVFSTIEDVIQWYSGTVEALDGK